MKRDILIFPKFKNIAKIQEIRDKYDPLAKAVLPHITIVFPFSDDMSDEKILQKVQESLKEFKAFNITFKGLSLYYDEFYAKKNVIFLNCIEGKEEIIKLHDILYKEIFASHLDTRFEYTPHITLGNADSLDDIHLDDKFEYLVDELTLEGIGKDDSSIILGTIKLR